jgi:hypothetical protein
MAFESIINTSSPPGVVTGTSSHYDAVPPDPPGPFEVALYDAFDEMIGLLVKKRKAYGPGNLVRFGAIGIVIRASDKIDRLANLLKAGETTSADGESIEDAFKDLVGYGVLGLLHQRGKLIP